MGLRPRPSDSQHAVLLAALVALASAEPQHHHAVAHHGVAHHGVAHAVHHAPELLCRETNTVVQREICTYVYEREDVVTDCQTTQVTYDEKSETMKVTACGVQAPAYGYAADPYHGEHQVCHEEYQTQAYKVPLVTAPLTVQCSLAYPAPKEVCVTKDITITEVKCEDKVENKCFNVAKFVDATNTVDQKEIIIGEPSCEQITLTLDTQACRQQHHKVVAHAVPVVHHAPHHAVHHAAPVHHAPVYHGK